MTIHPVLTTAFCLSIALSFGCDTGSGVGEVASDFLLIEDCIEGPYDLRPNFFAANPFPGAENMEIRVQRGDDIIDFSDGLIAMVRGVQEIRDSKLSVPIALGVPDAMLPDGAPKNRKVPQVTLALYLHDSCHSVNGTIYSVGGSITFNSLFSGDTSESDPADLLTEAVFEAQMADPRFILPDGTYPPEVLSPLTGHFRFLFQQGQPAQPFP